MPKYLLAKLRKAFFKETLLKKIFAQSAGAVDYNDCFSVEG